MEGASREPLRARLSNALRTPWTNCERTSEGTECVSKLVLVKLCQSAATVPTTSSDNERLA